MLLLADDAIKVPLCVSFAFSSSTQLAAKSLDSIWLINQKLMTSDRMEAELCRALHHQSMPLYLYLPQDSPPAHLQSFLHLCTYSKPSPPPPPSIIYPPTSLCQCCCDCAHPAPHPLHSFIHSFTTHSCTRIPTRHHHSVNTALPPAFITTVLPRFSWVCYSSSTNSSSISISSSTPRVRTLL